MDIVIIFRKLPSGFGGAWDDLGSRDSRCPFGPTVRDNDDAQPVILFHDRRFEPDELVVKAKTPFRLHVVNSTKDPIEFESFERNRERVVLPGARIVVHHPALDPGSCKYFDDFHHDVGQGTITAK